MLAWLSESRFGQGLSMHALCNSEIVPTATVSDLIHRFDLTVLMMVVKKIDIRHASKLYTTHKHMERGKLNKQTSELSVCVVPVTAFSLVQIS